MPKYMVQATYSTEGLKGLMKDKATGRQAAISKALASVGGKLESLYFSFGEYDVVVIAEVPDNTAAAAISLAAGASGAARVQTTPLLTAEETDAALAKTPLYRPPGA